MRFVSFILVGTFAAQIAAAQTSSVIAPSYKFPQVRPPVHKIDQPIELNLQTLRYHPEEIAKVTLAVYTEQNGQAPAASWDFGPRDQVVLFERLALLEQPTVATTDTYTSPRKYTSLELTFTRRDGRKMPRLAVFKNTAVIEGEQQVWIDPESRLEKWLFSTARTFEDRVFANTALNVQTFRDCEWVGNLVVDTVNPNQCILPDGTLFLKIDPDDIQADPKQTTYDACYKAKRPILDEFPRKCVVPGGRVLVEPARLKEVAPAPIKKAEKPKPKAKAKPKKVEPKAVPAAETPTVSDLTTSMPQTGEFIPDSDVPAPVATPAPEKKAEAKPAAKKPAEAKAVKPTEKPAAEVKPEAAKPAPVKAEAAKAKAENKTADAKPAVTETAVAEAPAKPAAKAKTLPAVETPKASDDLQVVKPAAAP